MVHYSLIVAISLRESSLTGVDMSQAELNLAEKRLPDTATLVHAKAQNLEFIGDEEQTLPSVIGLDSYDPVGPIMQFHEF